MAKTIMSKRAFFPPSKQERFIRQSKKLLNLSFQDLARFLKVDARTLTDWQREKFSMPLTAVEKIAKKTRQKKPTSLIIKDAFWYVSKGARKGGLAVYKKYGMIGGNPVKRKKKWREWWNKEGRFCPSFIGQSLPVIKPRRSSDLAEFVGIVMGDGGISNYQVVITLHHKDDRKYSQFVAKLIKKLFKISPSIYHDKKKSVLRLAISRKKLVRYCQNIGLKVGNKIKQHLDIPPWIKGAKKLEIACLRGLMDTDGCLFVHRYKVGNKMYSYHKLSFTSASFCLRKSFYDILRKLGFKPRLTQDKDVRLESIQDVERYFALIGSHNPKYLKKYLK